MWRRPRRTAAVSLSSVPVSPTCAKCGALTPRRRQVGRGCADRDEVGRVNPLVGDGDASGVLDHVSEVDRPHVLDQGHRRALPLRDRVAEVPDLAVAEEVAVLHLFGAGSSRSHGRLLVAGAEPDERSDDRAEAGRFFVREVALLDDLELAADRPAYEQQVDQPDDPGLLQPLELGDDLALELGAVELEHEHLDGSEGAVVGTHDDSSFRFCWSNSSSVRTPWSFSAASCLSCSIAAWEMPPAAGAGGAGAGACWAC